MTVTVENAYEYANNYDLGIRFFIKFIATFPICLQFH